MAKRVYVEIGNICNLSCSFCPPMQRAPRQMSPEEFRHVMDEIAPIASEVYFHLLGEPLVHPRLDELLAIADEYAIPVCITTNATLLSQRKELLLSHRSIIKKVNISLQSYEANRQTKALLAYLSDCIDFAKDASRVGIFSVFRLWNLDRNEKHGANAYNDEILAILHKHYPDAWQRRYSGYRIGQNAFLECAEIFDWPSESEAVSVKTGYCHGLTDQIAILADGTVVPCCLDSEGQIPLGNIHSESLADILHSERAEKMERGLRCGYLTEPLCQKCTYRRRFQK